MELGMIDTIVYLIGNLFRMYIISRVFNVFFETKVSKRARCVRILCYTLYFFVNSMAFLYFDWNPNIIILTNIVGSAILSGTYPGSWKCRICAIVVTVATYIVCEDLLFYLLVDFQIEHLFTICILGANLLFFMIVLLLQKSFDLKNGENIAFPEWLAVILISVCSLFVSVIALDACRSEIAVATGGISIMLVNIFSFFLLDRVQKMYRRQMDLTPLEQQKKVYENQMLLLSESEEKITVLRHDIKNHFLSLELLAQENNCRAIQEYLSDIVPLLEPQVKFAATGNPVIDSFLNAKLGEAVAYGADVYTNLKIPKGISIAAKDISIILGNLLDNALRALREDQNIEGKKVLRITIKEEMEKLFIQIVNSHSGNVKKSGNLFRTTKAEKTGHGVGLKNVQKVVDAYCGQMETDHTKDLFSVKLIMFCVQE